MTQEIPISNAKPFIRVATLADVDELATLAARAFIHDPVFNFFNQIDHLLDPKIDKVDCEARRDWFSLLTTACILVGGRVTVVVDPSLKDKIVSAALWLPPKKRLAIWMIPTAIRSGIISVIRNWGLRGLWRIVVDYQESAEKKMQECFMTINKPGKAHDAWYLQLTFTDPDHEDKGLMSMLVRDAFDHAPDATFILEATTPKSRARYVHLGFENPTPIKFGIGKADGNGLDCKGDAAVGVEIWAMGKWPKLA